MHALGAIEHGVPGDVERRSRQRRRQRLAVAILTGICFAGFVALLQSRPQNGKMKGMMFRDWGKPELTLVLSGQMYGYMQPCGCSSP